MAIAGQQLISSGPVSSRTPFRLITPAASAVSLSFAQGAGGRETRRGLASALPLSKFVLQQTAAKTVSRRARITTAAASDATAGSSTSSATDSLLPVFKYFLAATALATAVIPQQACELILGITPLPYCTLLLQISASYLAVAAVSFHNLQDAAVKDHLKSDTYQRLSLTLLVWHTATCALQVAFKGLTPPGWGAIVGGVAVIAATWSTYTRKIQRSSVQAITDAGRGLVNTLPSLMACSTARSGLWAAAAIAQGLYGIKLLLTSPEGQQGVGAVLLQPTHGAFPRFLVRLLGVHLLLAAAVSFNVKDAVERGRLSASTFQNFVKVLGAVAVYASVQLYRLAPLALTSTTTSQSLALYRALQVKLAAVALLSVTSIQSKKT